MPLEDFLSMRLSLVRGGLDIRVGDAASPDRLFQEIQLMALSQKPVEVDMVFEKNLAASEVVLDDHLPPMGPSAPIRRIDVDSASPGKDVERVYGDTDLKAGEAMRYLYSSGIDVSRISKILSIGAVGEGKARRVVPTRWSITAVDKNISDTLVEKIKDFPQIDKFMAFVRSAPGNLFMGILTPSNWIYEWGESWFPGSTWNQWGTEAFVEIDDEGYNGRKDYPGIGGCYYSARLAVAEKFSAMGRSGGAITWREIYPSFSLPVGVWYVRENMRLMFSSKPQIFDTLDDAVRYLSSFMEVNPSRWISGSKVYSALKYNNLDRFFRI